MNYLTYLTYTDDGMFTRFTPQTEDGERMWRTLYGNRTLFLSERVPAMLAQFEAAGYTVREVKDTH